MNNRTPSVALAAAGAGKREIAVAAPGNSLTLLPRDLNEMAKLADLLASAGTAVREGFRGNAGACFHVVTDALTWGFAPSQVIRKAYVVNGSIAYEAQLVHALINTRADVDDFDVVYEGEGDEKVCVVSGIINGKRREYRTPKLGIVKKGKKSPLWVDDPEQQLHYYGTRSFGRRWLPELMLGVYTKEEMDDADPRQRITNADRRGALDMQDLLRDEDTHHPDAPEHDAPFMHRYSFALERQATVEELQAVMLAFANEIDTLPEADRDEPRELSKLHLERCRGTKSTDEVMAFSRKYREPADEVQT